MPADPSLTHTFTTQTAGQRARFRDWDLEWERKHVRRLTRQVDELQSDLCAAASRLARADAIESAKAAYTRWQETNHPFDCAESMHALGALLYDVDATPSQTAAEVDRLSKRLETRIKMTNQLQDLCDGHERTIADLRAKLDALVSAVDGLKLNNCMVVESRYRSGWSGVTLSSLKVARLAADAARQPTEAT